MIVCNDATVKGGTYYPMTVKKHLRAQEIAEENRLPCIYLVDSGGANLPNQDEVFPDRDHFGRIFYNQARMSAQGHRPDRRGDGLLHRRRRLRAGDERRDDHRQGAGHDLPRRPAAGEGRDRRGGRRRGRSAAATCTPGSRASPTTWPRTTPMRWRSRGRRCANLGPAAGAGDRAARARCRRRWTRRRSSAWSRPTRRTPYDIREVIARHRRRLATSTSSRRASARRWSAASRISTACRSASSPTTACCSRRARRRARTSSSSAASAGSRSLFLQNITGFMVGAKYEAGGIASDGAKLVTAVATAAVPKVTVIVGGSFGAGNYGMCGRAYRPALPLDVAERAHLGDGRRAGGGRARHRAARRRSRRRGGAWSAEEEAAFKQPVLDQFETPGPPALRLRPALGRRRSSTRARPATCWRSRSAAALNAPIGETRFGVFRM